MPEAAALLWPGFLGLVFVVSFFFFFGGGGVAGWIGVLGFRVFFWGGGGVVGALVPSGVLSFGAFRVLDFYGCSGLWGV